MRDLIASWKIVLVLVVTGVIACGGSHETPPADAGVDAIPPDAPPPPCDPVAQDCTGAVDTKCTVAYVPQPGGPSPKDTCVAPTGGQGAGASCSRTSTDVKIGAGHDTCAPGLWCSAHGLVNDPAAPPTTMECRPFCHASSQCDTAAGEACVPTLDAIDWTTDGFCMPVCQVFGAPCANGMTCRPWHTVEDDAAGSPWKGEGICEAAGTVPEGGSCYGPLQPDRDACGPGLFCDNAPPSSAVCFKPCDTVPGGAGTHACPQPQTCKPSSYWPGMGLCDPA